MLISNFHIDKICTEASNKLDFVTKDSKDLVAFIVVYEMQINALDPIQLSLLKFFYSRSARSEKTYLYIHFDIYLLSKLKLLSLCNQRIFFLFYFMSCYITESTLKTF